VFLDELPGPRVISRTRGGNGLSGHQGEDEE
jgi:hypothetical protein